MRQTSIQWLASGLMVAGSAFAVGRSLGEGSQAGTAPVTAWVRAGIPTETPTAAAAPFPRPAAPPAIQVRIPAPVPQASPVGAVVPAPTPAAPVTVTLPPVPEPAPPATAAPRIPVLPAAGVTAAPPPAIESRGSGPWTEVPSTREMPELCIENTTETPLTLKLTDGSATLEWPVEGALQRPLVAGTYDYSLWAPGRDRPEQTGTLRCRKFRRYELQVATGPLTETRRRDLGDGSMGAQDAPQ